MKSLKLFRFTLAAMICLINTNQIKALDLIDSDYTNVNCNLSDSSHTVFQYLSNNYQFKLKNSLRTFYNFNQISYLNTNHLEKVEVPKFYFDRTNINYTRLGLVSGAILGTALVVHYYQKNAWWKDQRKSFHFTHDWDYALWNDKIGHMWGTIALQHLFSSAFNWSNINFERSMVYGSLLALSYELYIEFEDGFAPSWGFSPGDALFNIFGASYPLIQYYYPFFKNINFKMSYTPSRHLREGKKIVNDDHEGQNFYLSFKVNNFLPKKIEKIWPDFLCIAIGYDIENWNLYGSADKIFYLALDYDLEGIPLYGEFWQFLKNTLNLIHLPAPGIKFHNNKFYLTIAY